MMGFAINHVELTIHDVERRFVCVVNEDEQEKKKKKIGSMKRTRTRRLRASCCLPHVVVVNVSRRSGSDVGGSENE